MVCLCNILYVIIMPVILPYLFFKNASIGFCSRVYWTLSGFCFFLRVQFDAGIRCQGTTKVCVSGLYYTCLENVTRYNRISEQHSVFTESFVQWSEGIWSQRYLCNSPFYPSFKLTALQDWRYARSISTERFHRLFSLPEKDRHFLAIFHCTHCVWLTAVWCKCM